MNTRNDNSNIGLFNKAFPLLFGIIFLLLIPKISPAQFTYISASTGFKNNLIGPTEGFYSSDSRAVNLGLFLKVKAIHRPLRYLGLGAEVAIPLVQGYINSAYDFEAYGGNKPQYFEYKAQQAFGFTAIASLFADTEANFHADFRFSYNTFNEEFVFDSYGNIVSYQEKVGFPAVGFALGFMPHVTRHLFFDIDFGFDFLLMGSDPDFSYRVDYERSFEQGTKYVTLESQLSGVKPSFFMNIGLGYYF